MDSCGINLTQTAQQVLACYYHDVIHRCGHKPDFIEDYLSHRGPYADENAIHHDMAPLSFCLFGNTNALNVEELSCVFAEYGLTSCGLSEYRILPILLAIYNTVPFSPKSHPLILEERLRRVIEEKSLTLSADEIRSALQVAIFVSNRDQGSYADDTLEEFDKKTWAMMHERIGFFPLLTIAPPDLETHEGMILFDIYRTHKKLLDDLRTGKFTLYHSLDPNDPVVIQKNAAAVALLVR